MSTITAHAAGQTSGGSMSTAEIKDHIAAMFGDRPEPTRGAHERRTP